VPLPASGKPERIAENAALFDFELSDEQMAALDGFDEHFFASVTATKFGQLEPY
jgi:diketogulonate reductase-like aldo/keto reductase